MDFANRGNRPAAQQTPPSSQNEQPSVKMPMENKNSTKKNIMDFHKLSALFMLFAGALLIVAALFGLVFASNGNSESDLIQKEKYQAVFLDSADGQVYFGKLDVYNKNLYRLSDIYYVRVEQPIQPQGANQQGQQPNISLAKLGNELHGPQDQMFISKDRVLYWENLKDDGQVVTAITEFKKNGEQAPQTQTNQGNANQQGAAPSSGNGSDNASGTQPTGAPQQNDTPTTNSDQTPTQN